VPPDDYNFQGNFWAVTQDINYIRSHQYNAPYWPRAIWVAARTTATPWGEVKDWKCVCHAKPEYGLNPQNVHPLKEHAISPTGVNVAMADASVMTLSGSISDKNWVYATTPADSDIYDDSQLP
jgi:hypothetical protein